MGLIIGGRSSEADLARGLMVLAANIGALRFELLRCRVGNFVVEGDVRGAMIAGGENGLSGLSPLPRLSREYEGTSESSIVRVIWFPDRDLTSNFLMLEASGAGGIRIDAKVGAFVDCLFPEMESF